MYMIEPHGGFAFLIHEFPRIHLVFYVLLRKGKAVQSAQISLYKHRHSPISVFSFQRHTNEAPHTMRVQNNRTFVNICSGLLVSLLARLFSKRTSRYCHSPGVVVVVGVMQKL